MDEVRILEIKQSVFANNDQRAELLRRELKEKRIFLLNLMSSPGSGKTTTLTRTIERLRDEFKIGVMEADIDSDVDARTIAATGVKSIQLHTGGMCHLDADMTWRNAEKTSACATRTPGSSPSAPRQARAWTNGPTGCAPK